MDYNIGKQNLSWNVHYYKYSFTSIQNSNSLAKNVDFECQYIRIHFEEKMSKIFYITFTILSFSNKNVLTIKWPSLESTFIDETIRHASKWFTPAQRTQNLEFVNLKCVTSTQPIPVPFNLTILCIPVVSEKIIQFSIKYLKYL